MKTTHTPGPYMAVEQRSGWTIVSDNYGVIASEMNLGTDMGESDAARIVACLNALKGIEDPEQWVAMAKSHADASEAQAAQNSRLWDDNRTLVQQLEKNEQIYNALVLEVTELRAERDELRAALKELVEVKDSPLNTFTLSGDPTVTYERRIERDKSAWATARRLITTLAIFLSLTESAIAQDWFRHKISFIVNGDGGEFAWGCSWRCYNIAGSQGMYAGFSGLVTYDLWLPQDTVRFEFIDLACDDPDALISIQNFSGVTYFGGDMYGGSCAGNEPGCTVQHVTEGGVCKTIVTVPLGNNYHPCCPAAPQESCPADINHDGIVGVGDLIVFIGQFGTTCQ